MGHAWITPGPPKRHAWVTPRVESWKCLCLQQKIENGRVGWARGARLPPESPSSREIGKTKPLTTDKHGLHRSEIGEVSSHRRGRRCHTGIAGIELCKYFRI